MKNKVITGLCLVLISFNNVVAKKHAEGCIEVLNPDSIIRISFENNLKIKAARHKLHSAEFNFKLFESEFTQFIPITVDSKVEKSSDDETFTEITAGIKKEFFDGSFMALYAGNSTDITSGVGEHTQFIEGLVQFPLFSSNRKLNRIIKRTFEENEVYSANLEYVNTIRRTIRNALEMYYDFVPRMQILEMVKKYHHVLKILLEEKWFDSHQNDRRQLVDEIKSLDSEIEQWEVHTASLKV
ncbi:MAG: hypothetical protein ACE5HS_16200 [bacterium]